jgi:glucose-6-phosphate 1-dehydrogenase
MRDDVKCFIANKLALSVVVLGASGDLAKKKTFPALFILFKKGYAIASQPAVFNA